MTTRDTNIEGSARREISDLLPWYAAGTLSSEETVKVEAALALDSSLRDELDLVREDRDMALLLADTAPAPSPKVLGRLMDAIEAEPATVRQTVVAANQGVVDWFATLLAGLRPRTLAYAAAAGALVLVVQAGVIGSSWLSGPATFQTASLPGQQQASDGGTFALIGFQPGATAEAIAETLTSLNAAIVDGPRPGGVYRVRLSGTRLPQEQFERMLRELRQRTTVVRFAGPSS